MTGVPDMVALSPLRAGCAKQIGTQVSARSRRPYRGLGSGRNELVEASKIAFLC